ncbi:MULTISPECIES: DNA-processing protein DprA [Sporosarcina]|uniref:DNA-processing protein DprA n=1 Tax=Sporosarcina TaxID=1569 RepID=UPI0005904F3F|nr:MULTISPECIES: DNA-processing protein DprA [Sporosarcina]WJY28750.1 DNA-processing protein DprA [Sporosarcina sp. 0.2-SM1T-5]
MNLSEQEIDLLKLHYAWPAPYPKLHRYLSYQTGDENFTHSSLKQPADLIEKLTGLSRLPLLELLLQKGIFPIPYTHPDYPPQLKQLIDPPAVLYTKGNRKLLKKENLTAIIGARQATSYSVKAMEQIVPPLVANGFVIVSGLAKGADTFAHEAAIRYGGETIAVLGNGFFHLYPKENRQLAEQIAAHHLLITEYPPYHKPAKWTFPMRNRIISGLSRSLIITEAAEKSGTMSTIEHALEHGKEVFAVPGPIDSPLSLGPNRLLNEGATGIWNGFQLIATVVES